MAVNNKQFKSANKTRTNPITIGKAHRNDLKAVKQRINEMANEYGTLFDLAIVPKPNEAMLEVAVSYDDADEFTAFYNDLHDYVGDKPQSGGSALVQGYDDDLTVVKMFNGKYTAVITVGTIAFT